MLAKLKGIIDGIGEGRIQLLKDGEPLKKSIGIVYSSHEDVEFLVDLLDTKKERVELRCGSGRISLPYSEVILIEKVDKKTYFYGEQVEGYTTTTLESYEKNLYTKGFVRINKSQIVNFKRIERIEPMLNSKISLKLDDGSSVEVSRGYREGFNHFFRGC